MDTPDATYSAKRADDAYILRWSKEVGRQRLAMENALQDRVEVAGVPKVAESREVILQRAPVMRISHL